MRGGEERGGEGDKGREGEMGWQNRLAFYVQEAV